MLGMAQGANAADLPDAFLRGSTIDMSAASRWDGVYFGGHVGANIVGSDFTQATSSMAELLVRPGSIFTSAAATPLGSVDATGIVFGAFAGYNVQMDGAVLSVEANYSHSNTGATATNFITGSWRASDGSLFPYTANGSATARVTDYGVLRARGGWAAGNFMPYATIGFAVGHAEVERTAAATLLQPGFPPVFVTVSENSSGQFAYGWAAGIGLDYLVLNNVFLRAEYEYVKFADFQSLKMHIHNIRFGAALKF